MNTRETDPRDPRDETAGTGTRPEEPQAGPVFQQRDDRSVTELVRELANEVSDLVRQEMALARAEMKEKVDAYQGAAARMAVGGALLFGALLVFLWAVNIGLTALFAQWMGLDVAGWLAPVVLALVLGVIGYALVKGGQSTMRSEGITPEKSRQSLETDRSWARTRARQFKERVRHE